MCVCRYDDCVEAQHIFDGDLDSMLCYLLEGTHLHDNGKGDPRGKGKHVAGQDDDPW